METTSFTSIHGTECISNALAAIQGNTDDTAWEIERGLTDVKLEDMTPATVENATEWIASGMVTCRCDEYFDGYNVAALGARIVRFLPAAIDRFGSLDSAVDHLVSLMADDAYAAIESQ